MRRTLPALVALLLAACAPDAALEAPDADQLAYENPQDNPNPGPILGFEICNDGRDNDNDGAVDESPCRKRIGWIGGSDDGQSIMDNPEDLRVPYDGENYVMSDNKEGDIEITTEKGELVGLIELPAGTKTAHVGIFVELDERENVIGKDSLGLVLDIDSTAFAFALDTLEGSWTTEQVKSGEKR